MSVKTSTYSRISRQDRDSVARSGHRQRSTATDLGLSAKRAELCHLFRVVISLLWIPGVSRGATPGYSNGIPSGCHETGMRRIQESAREFVPQDIGGESVMPQDCPEFARGGGGRGSGVKAVPQTRDRSPRPGGIRGGIEHDEHPWGLRRGVDTADSGLVGIRRRSKWGWGFVWQDAGGKSVSVRDCPEFQWGKAEGSSINAKGRNDEECIVLIGGVGEDTVAGHRGIPTLDLDLNHDLDLSGLARPLFENPSEPGQNDEVGEGEPHGEGAPLRGRAKKALRSGVFLAIGSGKPRRAGERREPGYGRLIFWWLFRRASCLVSKVLAWESKNYRGWDELA